MNFEELLLKLPRPSNLLPVNRLAGFGVIESDFRQFVAPDVTPRPDVALHDDPSVIIISAPGAVGKSTLGREVARRMGVPLWDLALTGPVGDGSVSGQLVSAYGASSFAQVWSAFDAGSYFVVIDALDEGRLKVNEGSFVAFLRDIAALCQQFSGKPGVRFVLLGRTIVAETAWLELDSAGINTNLLVIEAFDRSRAERYIDLRIEGMDSAERIAAYRGPFETARDDVFDEIARAVDAESEGAGGLRFLGYAPVLDAIAVLLSRQTNYAQMMKEITTQWNLSRGSSARPAIQLLLTVVTNVMMREREQKVLHNLKPLLADAAVAGNWSKWDVLYDVEEQQLRVAAQLLGANISVPAKAPAPVWAPYEEQLATWVTEHPFLRDGRRGANVVFESYMIALALVKNPSELRGHAENFVRRMEYRPSFLLAEFYIAILGEIGSLNVPAEDVGVLYDAIMSAQTPGVRVRFSLDGEEPADFVGDQMTLVEGEFEFAAEDDGRTLSVINFSVEVKPTTELRFGRTLQDASIIVPCTVVLGATAREFVVGPSVTIRADMIELAADTLTVGVGRKKLTDRMDLSVNIEGKQYKGFVASRPVAHVPFTVRWPGAREYPWTDFAGDVVDGGIPEGHIRQMYRRFRRIILTLRSHSKGSLARFRGKIEHQRILKGAAGEALLEALLDDGVLYLTGSFYHWEPDAAQRHVGVSWTDLQQGRASPLLVNYLSSFVRQKASLFGDP